MSPCGALWQDRGTWVPDCMMAASFERRSAGGTSWSRKVLQTVAIWRPAGFRRVRSTNGRRGFTPGCNHVRGPLAALPQLGYATAKQIAALGGVAPRVHQSGGTHKRYGLDPGRGLVKVILFYPRAPNSG